MSEPVYESEKTQLIVDNLLLSGQQSEYTENNAVSKYYVDGSIQSAVDSEANARTQMVNSAVSDLSSIDASLQSQLNIEISTRSSDADVLKERVNLTELSISMANEAGVAQDMLISNLQNDKMDKEGGDFVGSVKLVDSFLNFGDNWRVKGSADGSKLIFQHKKADDVWRTAVPFICAP